MTEREEVRISREVWGDRLHRRITHVKDSYAQWYDETIRPKILRHEVPIMWFLIGLILGVCLMAIP